MNTHISMSTTHTHNIEYLNVYDTPIIHKRTLTHKHTSSGTSGSADRWISQCLRQCKWKIAKENEQKREWARRSGEKSEKKRLRKVWSNRNRGKGEERERKREREREREKERERERDEKKKESDRARKGEKEEERDRRSEVGRKRDSARGRKEEKERTKKRECSNACVYEYMYILCINIHIYTNLFTYI